MVKRILFVSLFALLLSGVAFPQAADWPTNIGARYNGMGNTGSAIVTGGSSIAMNPAGLANIQKFDVEATANLVIMTMQSPSNGDNTEDSLTSTSAIGLFGMGYRINEIFTVGFLLYAPGGGGAVRENVTMGISPIPRDVEGYLIFLEFGPCIAINLPGNLKLGFVYRINYAENWAKTFNYDLATSSLSYNDIHMNGYGFTGYRVGLQWDPLDTLHFGISYRSFTKIKLEGTTESEFMSGPFTGMTTDSDTTMEQRYADGIHAGVSYEFIPDRLTVNFDYTLNFWSRYQSATTKTTTFGITTRTTIPYRWYDTHCFKVGTEWWVFDWFAFRAGFSYSTTAANPRYHNILSYGAPGPNYTFSAGFGFKFGESWNLDIAINYMYNNGEVETSDKSMYSTIGEYQYNGFYIAIGGSYKM